jgi:hypothetical protein
MSNHKNNNVPPIDQSKKRVISRSMALLVPMKQMPPNPNQNQHQTISLKGASREQRMESQPWRLQSQAWPAMAPLQEIKRPSEIVNESPWLVVKPSKKSHEQTMSPLVPMKYQWNPVIESPGEVGKPSKKSHEQTMSPLVPMKYQWNPVIGPPGEVVKPPKKRHEQTMSLLVPMKCQSKPVIGSPGEVVMPSEKRHKQTMSLLVPMYEMPIDPNQSQHVREVLCEDENGNLKPVSKMVPLVSTKQPNQSHPGPVMVQMRHSCNQLEPAISTQCGRAAFARVAASTAKTQKGLTLATVAPSTAKTQGGITSSEYDSYVMSCLNGGGVGGRAKQQRPIPEDVFLNAVAEQRRMLQYYSEHKVKANNTSRPKRKEQGTSGPYERMGDILSLTFGLVVRVVLVPADGHCGFHAFAEFGSVHQLRKYCHFAFRMDPLMIATFREDQFEGVLCEDEYGNLRDTKTKYDWFDEGCFNALLRVLLPINTIIVIRLASWSNPSNVTNHGFGLQITIYQAFDPAPARKPDENFNFDEQCVPREIIRTDNATIKETQDAMRWADGLHVVGFANSHFCLFKLENPQCVFPNRDDNVPRPCA